MSIDVLIEKIRESECPVVAGLDPKLSYVPEFIKEEAYRDHGRGLKGATEAILRFNVGLIAELCDVVPAVKLQAAYYEMYGLMGMETLYKTASYAKKRGLYVIIDGKRNDIGSTAEAYSSAWLGKTQLEDQTVSVCEADGLTVNPYLGTDGIAPFIDDCCQYGKMIFALVKTSNPSSGELQDLELKDGRKLYETVASLVSDWGENSIGSNGYSAVGAVVGATYPQQAERLRQLMPHTYFLVPGYGAQGATAEDVAKSFHSDGLGALVNSSRNIMCAYKKKEDPMKYAIAAKDEANEMGKAIRAAIFG